uniref:DUF3857 domain-containing protein n=1 Tax=mine drainage metagenome TaxID=410659 RepID=E6QI70_9ZZZZ
MIRSRSQRWMCWLLLVFGSALARGQFQPTVAEELKMTSEPKAPGAAAIYLYREETVDDVYHYHSFYARIKVLSEKGKDLATVSIPYPKGLFKVDGISGRTVHADGTVVALNVKPTDLLERSTGSVNYHRMVFTLPSVEVGSILEYRWQLRYGDDVLSSPDWQIQQPYFVRKAHYQFVPTAHLDRVTNGNGDIASRLMYGGIVPAGAAVVRNTSGRYTLDVSDIAAIPEEEYMPPLSSLIAQVEFYYTPYTTMDEFWNHEGGRWSRRMDTFAAETGGLKQAVRGIVNLSDSADVKLQKLYEAVMKIENTDYTLQKSDAERKQLHEKMVKHAEDVWKEKSGTSDEIALLYLAMARSAGLKAYAMEVSDRNRRIFDAHFLSMGQLDDVLVVVVVDGKEVVLDPGERYAPYGQLHWTHMLTGGIRQSDQGVVLTHTNGNSYKQAATLRAADVTVAADGTVTGVARFTMFGPEALRWRHIAIENDVSEVKKLFNEMVDAELPDGVHGEFDHFIGIEDYESGLMGIVNLSGTLGTATGKRVFLPGEFFESRAKHPFVAEAERKMPVDMRYADLVQDKVTYYLPDEWSVESTPPDTTIPMGEMAVFQAKSAHTASRIDMARSFARGFTLLDAKSYGQLHDFYQRVATADTGQVVLHVTPKMVAR